MRIAESLIERSSVTALHDRDLAREQAALARSIALKFNLRFDWRLKRFYCHGCKELIVPGINARVRMGQGRALLTTCSECGYVNRKILNSVQ